MHLQTYIMISNLLFLQTMAYLLSVNQSTPTITIINQTISQIQSNSNFNTTLQIEGEGFKFLIVEFQQISSQQSNAALLYNDHFPTSQINKKILFKDMDYDSYALKKQNHYLFIENFSHLKFITILSNVSITFDLILTGTNQSKCVNNCNNHGKCILGRCLCVSNFIGKDCSFKATELKIQTWTNQTLSSNESFFFYQQVEKSKELELAFYTNSEQNISVLEMVSSFMYQPTLRFYDFYGKFNNSVPLKQIIVSKGYSDLDDDDFNKEEDENKEDEDILQHIMQYWPSKLIILVLCQDPNTQISIKLQKIQPQPSSLNFLDWLIPVILLSIIILLLLLILLCRFIKTRKRFLNNYTNFQLIITNQICQLCDKNLAQQNLASIFAFKTCQQQHPFHKKCLFKFFQKDHKFDHCPSCPQILINQNEEIPTL